MPDFLNYLLYLMVYQKDAPADVRQAAGLILKTKLMERFGQLHPSVLPYIQSNVLVALGDDVAFIRVAAGIIVSIHLLYHSLAHAALPS